MKALEDYVPKELKPFFKNAVKDVDGVWFFFSDDVQFNSTECSTVHEGTVAECRKQMRKGHYELNPDEEVNFQRIVNAWNRCKLAAGR